VTLPLPTTVDDPATQQCLDRLAQQFPIQGANLAKTLKVLSGTPTLAFGTGTFVFTASTISAEATVTHGLPKTPTVVIGSASDPALSFAVKSLGSTTFKAQSFDAFGATTGSFTFYWLAIG
jgi:hypothetical protein